MNLASRLSISPARVVLLGLVSALLCLFWVGSAQAAQVGTNPDITWGTSRADVDHTVALLKDAGVRWVRTSVDLSGAEYSGPGQLNAGYLSQIDYAISAVHAAGINVLMEFDRAPYWASGDPGKHLDAAGNPQFNKYWSYANNQDYARIAADLVNRYKALGVHSYEVWNEPNNQSFWPSGVNAAQYTALLKAAYPAIKAADPSASVAMAGLMNQGAYAYLQSMYDAGAKGSYDQANFHIYPAGDPTVCRNGGDGRAAVNSFCLLGALRSEMLANGDTKPVLVTEMGWSTCSQSYCVAPQAQADDVTKAYQLLNTPGYSYVQTAFAYQFRDLYWNTDPSTWDGNLGLLNKDFTPKPAYNALKAAALGLAGPLIGTSAAVSARPPVTARRASLAGSVRLQVSRSSMPRKGGPVAHAARRASRLRAHGNVRLASAARVTLLFERQRGGRWVTARVDSARVSRNGSFSRRLTLTHGAWRVCAVYGTARSRNVAVRVV